MYICVAIMPVVDLLHVHRTIVEYALKQYVVGFHLSVMSINEPGGFDEAV